MFCTNCGKEENSEAIFCTNCGTHLLGSSEEKKRKVFNGETSTQHSSDWGFWTSNWMFGTLTAIIASLGFYVLFGI